jgi:hypothetical protein
LWTPTFNAVKRDTGRWTNAKQAAALYGKNVEFMNQN